MKTTRIFPLGFPWQTADPFLFCVHHLDTYPAGNEEMGPDAPLTGRNLGNDFVLKDGWRMYHGQQVPGFPAHPHCGFETVTLVTRGYCDHADSLGAAARFGEGDAQWITTGSGLQHSEMFPLLDREGPNTLELFQIWLNLPRRSKSASPYFSMIWKEQIPVWKGNGVQISLVAGSLGDVRAPEPPPDSWAHDPESDVHIGLISMGPGAAFELPATAPGSNRYLFLFEGEEVFLEEEPLKKGQGAELPESAFQLRNGKAPARLLWLQGRPIGEPVARYGPFVMNEPPEIDRVLENFRNTRFGGWPWRHQDPVHERGAGRFAQFPDGRRETP
ncbi:MAG TPA: pirin family protein [Robiginitalea sp.]|nr:pirin family protein [Robiginitalea sp.]